MRVVFLGFHTWGTVALESIIKAGHKVPLVITHPETATEYDSIWNDSVAELCQKYGIYFLEYFRLNNQDVVNTIRDADPDIIISCNWRTYLSPEILKIPKYKSLNIHEALLPKYGGFAPISWAIINGETETGVTIHFMDEDIDVGDIVLQEKVKIDLEDTATDIYYKTLPFFADLPVKALDLIEKNRVIPKPQERSELTFFHKRYERDNLIDWEKSGTDIYNLIRAQSDPYPNAYTYYRGQKLKIKSASLPDICYCGTPGRIFCRLPSGVVVVGGQVAKGANQGIVIHHVQEEGGEIREANAYFEKLGDYLGE
jgi:methionyl-tRNA formyltransferase